MKTAKRKAYLALRRLFGKSDEVFTPHGIPVRIPKPGDLTLRYFLAKGRPYEAAEADMVRTYLARDTNVIELGGCMGVVSALIRHQIGPDATHLIVEANPRLAGICDANARQNAAPGKTTVTAAAIDYSGAATVTFASGHSAHVGHLARAGEGGITVPTIRLSDLAAQLPQGPFALICDIEGAEMALFQAEEPLLSRINLIVLETHPLVYPNGTKDLRTLTDIIAQAGLKQVRQVEDVLCFQRVT